jgi:catechol 2,3-dioxygenase-like lactoylglutathione lyase family enzyme
MFSAPQMTFYSHDLARMAAFYEAAGFRLAFRTPAEGPPDHVELALDGFSLGIALSSSAQRDHGLPADPTGAAAEVVLWTDDVDRGVAHLEAAGATLLSAPHDWLDALRVAWVTDPDGNPVQLVQHRA